MSEDTSATTDETKESPQAEAPAEPTELEKAEARASEFYANWQRSAADLINYRRRVEQEREDLQKFASAEILAELLQVVDDCERALATLPPELHRLSWVQGVIQIYQKMHWSLGRHGVTPIEAADQLFDPTLHEAVLRDDDVPAGEQTHVVAELQRGYRIHDRVLRPALVKVGRKPQDETTKTEESESLASDGS
jgi:molecular chaperone GrpE